MDEVQLDEVKRELRCCCGAATEEASAREIFISAQRLSVLGELVCAALDVQLEVAQLFTFRIPLASSLQWGNPRL